MSQENEITIFQRNKALNGMTLSHGRQARANPLPTDGPRTLTCWHGEFQSFG
jgi:hypothetical protein